jgi:hypothetical protein
MFGKIGLRILALSLVFVLLGSDVTAQTRINFRRGASSATVSGSIGGDGYREYVLRGRAGQVISIRITSGNGSVVVNAGSASGKNFSLDMSGGDHVLSVVNTSGRATRYTLTVSIR